MRFPSFSHHLCAQLLVVVEDSVCDVTGDVIPPQCKLNQVVHHTSVSVCKINPDYDELPHVFVSIP